MENELVHDIIRDTWRLGRVDRAERALVNRVIAAKEDSELDEKSPIQSAAYASLVVLPEVQETLKVIHGESSNNSPGEAGITINAVKELKEEIPDQQREFDETSTLPLENLRHRELQRFKKTFDVAARLLDAIVPTDGSQAMERLDRQRRLIRKDRLNCYSALKVLQDGRKQELSSPKSKILR